MVDRIVIVLSIVVQKSCCVDESDDKTGKNVSLLPKGRRGAEMPFLGRYESCQITGRR